MAFDPRFINAALTRAAFEPVSELPGTTAEGRVAHENYEKVVVAALTGYPWKFGSTERKLNYLGEMETSRWRYYYQMPADLLHIRKVEVSGVPIAYERMGDKLLCDVDSTVDVIAVGTWRVPEAQWPGYFSLPLTLDMEAIFLRSPAGQYEEAEARAEEARMKWEMGKSEDSKLSTPVDPRRSLTIEARNGRRPAPWSRG